jgi:hypothetical protein
VIGVQPPNEKTAWILGGALLALAVFWFGGARRRFAGPPEALLAHASQVDPSAPGTVAYR